jgi:hypothetical protein
MPRGNQGIPVWGIVLVPCCTFPGSETRIVNGPLDIKTHPFWKRSCTMLAESNSACRLERKRLGSVPVSSSASFAAVSRVDELIIGIRADFTPLCGTEWVRQTRRNGPRSAARNLKGLVVGLGDMKHWPTAIKHGRTQNSFICIFFGQTDRQTEFIKVNIIKEQIPNTIRLQ